MDKNKYRRENLYRVVVIYRENGICKGALFRNIECDKPGPWERSKAYFRKRFPEAMHCNIYGGVTRAFKRREYLTNKL